MKCLQEHRYRRIHHLRSRMSHCPCLMRLAADTDKMLGFVCVGFFSVVDCADLWHSWLHSGDDVRDTLCAITINFTFLEFFSLSFLNLQHFALDTYNFPLNTDHLFHAKSQKSFHFWVYLSARSKSAHSESTSSTFSTPRSSSWMTRSKNLSPFSGLPSFAGGLIVMRISARRFSRALHFSDFLNFRITQNCTNSCGYRVTDEITAIALARSIEIPHRRNVFSSFATFLILCSRQWIVCHLQQLYYYFSYSSLDDLRFAFVYVYGFRLKKTIKLSNCCRLCTCINILTMPFGSIERYTQEARVTLLR